MKKSTKGALAAAAAGTLLLGGAGSLAFWTDAETVDGTSITSGYLNLTDPTCVGTGLHDWQIDGGAAYDPATTRLVPGDTLTKVCTITVEKSGTHFVNANFDIDEGDGPTGSDELFGDELDLDVSYSKGATPLAAGPNATIAVADGDVITVDLSITWDYGVEDNSSNNPTAGLQAALDDITITATQLHN